MIPVSSQYEFDLNLDSSLATSRLAFNKNRFDAPANMAITRNVDLGG